jgi:predicted transcriptional regulator of viral defense system
MSTNRRDVRRALFRLAAEQGGYFTAADAKQIGYSHQAQAYHVNAGNWERVDRALYRLSEWIPGPHDDLIRWTLWSRRSAVVTHQSALAVHRVGELESARVHLTVPPGFAKRDDGVIVHRGVLPSADVIANAGFNVTTVIRSLIDIAPSTDEDQLAHAIEEARDGGLMTIRRLRERAEPVDPIAALRIERAIQRMTNS